MVILWLAVRDYDARYVHVEKADLLSTVRLWTVYRP